MGNCAKMALFYFLWQVGEDFLLLSHLNFIVFPWFDGSHIPFHQQWHTSAHKTVFFSITLFAPVGGRSILQENLFQKDGYNQIKRARKNIEIDMHEWKLMLSVVINNFVHQRPYRQSCGQCFVWSSLIYEDGIVVAIKLKYKNSIKILSQS